MTSTFSYTVRSCVAMAAALAALLSCAGTGRTISPAPLKNTRMEEADSLFAAGSFAEAKAIYEKIRYAYPPASEEAQKAHYYIAHIDVFHKNPWADWNAALTEFKSFASLYPDDARIDEVRSWIRILTTIKSFETEYRKTSTKVDALTADKQVIRETQRFHLDSMAVILRGSYDVRDSLSRTNDSLARKNSELVKTIIELEKKCQQVGR